MKNKMGTFIFLILIGFANCPYVLCAGGTYNNHERHTEMVIFNTSSDQPDDQSQSFLSDFNIYQGPIVLNLLGGGILALLFFLYFKSKIATLASRVNEEISKRHLAEQSIAQWKEKTNLLAKETTDGTWEWNLSSDKVTWSKQLFEKLGYAEDVIINSEFLIDITHPQNREEHRASVISHLKDGTRYDIEVQVRRANHEYVWLRITGTSIRKNGIVELVYGSVVDISQKKAAEKELLKTSEAQKTLDKTSEISRTGTWEFDIITSTLSWSKVTKEINDVDLDFEPDVETAISHYTEGVSRDTISRVYADSLKTGKPYDLELEILTPKNNLKWIRTIGIPEKADGEVIRIVGICQDITERKNAQNALFESKRLYKSLFDNSLYGIAMTDINFQFVSVNPAFCEIFGYSLKEIHQMGMPDVSLPEDAEKSKKMIGKLISQELDDFLIDKKYIKKDRSILHASTAVKAIRDENDNFIGCVASIKDITQQKEAEKKLIQSSRVEKILDKTSEISKTGTWELDLITSELIWNNVTKEIHDVSPNYIPKFETALDFYEDGISREIISRAIQGAIENGEQYDLELEITSARKKSKWVRTIGIPERKNGKTVRLLGIFQDLTEKKKVEEAIFEKNQMYKSIFENNLYGIAVSKKDSQFLKVNPAFCDIFGYSHKEIERMNMADMSLPEDLEKSESMSRKLASGEIQDFVMDKRYVKKDGTIMHATTAVKGIYDETGTYSGSVATIKDFTKQKEAELALKKSQERFKVTAETAPVALLITRISDNKILFVNNKFTSLFKYTYKNIIGLKVPDLFYNSQDRATLIQDLEKRNYVEDYDVMMRTAENKSFWARLSSKLTNLSDEDVIFTAFEDVSEQKRTQESLMQNERQLRTITSISPVGIFQTDAEGACIYVNQKWEEIAGLTKDEAIGFGWAKAIHPDDKQLVLDEWSKLSNEKIPFKCEYRFQREDGKVTWLFGEASAIIGNHGNLYGYVGTITDISELKHSEEERKELITELEVKNAEMERFIYAVSHDLKSPLITMKGFLGMLEKDLAEKNEDNIKSDINYMNSATEKMNTMLHELLELSRAGIISAEYTTQPINVIVDLALENVRGQIDNSEKNVNIRKTGLETALFCDRHRMTEVFQNLIDNAIKYMGDQKDPLIEIVASQTDSEVTCYIKDNGSGIDHKYQNKVFDLFDRLDNTVEGTGVGLALVKRIVESHEGTIAVDSKGKNRGTTFVLKFPLIIKEGKSEVALEV